MNNKLKKPLIFTFVLLPVSALGGFFTGIYSFETYTAEMRDMILKQIGSYEMFVLTAALQSVVYALVCGFCGYLLSEKVGLMNTFGFERKKLCTSLVITCICGIVFGMDYWVFGKYISEVAQIYETKITLSNFIASVLYGGIVEEILLRLFFMSLAVLVLWKLFFRDCSKEIIPDGVYIAANIIAALLFAAGHLPATSAVFGSITPLTVFRCFLYNGGLGAAFGWLYRKYGIQYAMLGHIGCHVISKMIWLIFI